jgi:hypothetical protein
MTHFALWPISITIINAILSKTTLSITIKNETPSKIILSITIKNEAFSITILRLLMLMVVYAGCRIFWSFLKCRFATIVVPIGGAGIYQQSIMFVVLQY